MINFASSPNGAVQGTGIPDVYSLEAGSAADLQRIVNERLAALAAGPSGVLLSVAFAAAGDGSRFACVLAVSVGATDYNYISGAEVTQNAPTLASFAAATTSRSALLVAQGGTPAEATAALGRAVLAAKPLASTSSINCSQFGVELVGSANGAQWLAGTVLADLAAV